MFSLSTHAGHILAEDTRNGKLQCIIDSNFCTIIQVAESDVHCSDHASHKLVHYTWQISVPESKQL